MDIASMLGQPGPGQGMPPGQGLTGPSGMGQQGGMQQALPFLMMLLQMMMQQSGGMPAPSPQSSGMPFASALGTGPSPIPPGL